MCNRGRRVCRNVHHCLNDPPLSAALSRPTSRSTVRETSSVLALCRLVIERLQEEYISIQLMEDRLRQYGLDIDTISALIQ